MMRKSSLAVLGALCLMPGGLQAAEFVGLAGGGTEVYLRLDQGETLQVGDSVPSPGKGPPLRVVDVLGPRVRLVAQEAISLKGKVKIELPLRPLAPPDLARPGSPPVAQTPSQLPIEARTAHQLSLQRDWKLAHHRNTEGLAEQAQEAEVWQILSRSGVPWVVDAKAAAGPATQRIGGQITLTAAGVRDQGTDKPWALLRLANRLDIENIAGTPLGWHHDVAAWLDQLGGDPGSSSRRQLQLRQAELALATGPQRMLGGSLGRTLAPDGTGLSMLDGATARIRLDKDFEFMGFGGFVPSIATTAPELQATRFGASAQGYFGLNRWNSLNQLTFSSSRFAGLADRSLAAWQTRAVHPSLGSVWAQAEIAIGRPDLSGTTWTSTTAPSALVRPVQGLLAWNSPGWSGWRTQVRYSYYRSEPTRELALALPLPAWSPSAYHQAYASLDLPLFRRVELQSALWGSHTSSSDPWESWRWGASLRARLPRWPTPQWDWATTVMLQSGPTLSGASASLSADWSPTAVWHAFIRGRFAHDRVETSAFSSDAMDLRMGIDWGRSPLTVGVTLGGRKTLATDSPTVTDWLDATLVASLRL